MGIKEHEVKASELKKFLDQKRDEYNRASFVADDPISLPHQFTQLQDIEIIAFWVAVLAWGRRQSIINSGKQLIRLMGHAPYDFIKNHKPEDRKPFLQFKHRTFQPTDTIYFLEFLQNFYRQNNSLELAFSQHLETEDEHIEKALLGFHELFFSLPNAPQRTRKHIARPGRKSTCKRLCMLLRWMVRQDDKGVDFGLWDTIKPRQLLLPVDVHVDRIARRYGLIQRKQTDWRTVLELTAALRVFDKQDPVAYDFALFGIGIAESQGLL